MDDLGIDTEWRLIKGNQSFFNITKKFHNSLQGEPRNFSEKQKKIYFDEIERNSRMMHFKSDLVIIHDPQPLALISFCKKRQPWVWRCHIDIKNAHRPAWRMLLPFINQYDGIVLSMKKYRRAGLKKPVTTIPPSIDPLSLKNRHRSRSRARRTLSRAGIDLEKPIISQISRFDKWKNPIGVLTMFKKIKKKADCQLVMCGDMASDDPEGPRIYNKVVKMVNGIEDVKLITSAGDLFVNSLQRLSSVVFQNSIKEGFGLTVSEALWKETPVIAPAVGGIPLQIKHRKTGILIRSPQEGVEWAVKLLKDDRLREQLGKNGKEHVRKNFLITRHLRDYIELIKEFV